MAITHIANGEDGDSARAKINQAIDKANLVDGKAEQTALVAEQNARGAADTNLQNQVNLCATKLEVAAETGAREAAVQSLLSQIGQRATTLALSSAVSMLQQADQTEKAAREQADNAIVQAASDETAARITGENVRVTYAEAASEPTRPGEANRFFTSDLDGAPSAVEPLPDVWKTVGQNGAVVAIPGAGIVAPLSVWRIEQQRQYRVRFVVQRATNTEDPANDAIRLALRWLDRNKAGLATTICADLVDIVVSSGRLEYFFDIAVSSADNVAFSAPAGAVYVRPFVRAFGSGITHVEVIEVVDLSDAIEFSPDVSEFRRQLAGFLWQVEDFTTRLEINEENIEASKDAGWFERGTLNDARLSTNVMLLAKKQTVTADKTFEAKLRMREEILIGDGQVANPGDAENPTATARILGDGDHLSIAPTDKAGGYITLKELTFSHAFGVWLAEGGFRTTGTFVATEDGQILRDLSVGRDASVSRNLAVAGNGTVVVDLAVGRDASVTRHFTVGENASVGGDLDVEGSAQIVGDLGVEQNLGVLGDATVAGTLGVTGVATLDNDLSVGGDLGVTGGATIEGNTAVTGTLGVTGPTTLVDLTATGTSIIGNEAADPVTLKGTLVNAYSSGLLSGADAAAWRTSLDVYNKAYVDNLIAAQDAMVFKGVIDCSGNPNYPAADRGWTYRVSVAGKIGGASGPNVEAGDILICITDGTAAGDQASVGANWAIIQVNIDGALTTANIGVTVQGYDADLAAIAGLTTSAYGRGLLTLASAAALRAQVNTYGVIATDTDATLTVGTDAERIRHTGTLTANRTITLATAGVAAGAVFRITRTGGGAFNLNIGAGPLKALAANTWATVIYDGAAWYLAEYGAL